MTEKKLIYIASPYAGDVEKNLAFARDAYHYCIEQGHVPIAPHLLYTPILDDTNPADRETGLSLGFYILERCDEMWVCGDQISAGMETELELAKQLGKPIHYISAEQIYGGRDSAYAIWAKGLPDRPFAGQAGFLCEDRNLLIFPSKKEAEVRVGDIKRLCMNPNPAADYECVEYLEKYVSDKRMHLEPLRELDTVPDFDPHNYQVKNRVYGDTGGHCMVATMEFYLPDLDKSVWVNCNNESVEITSADYVWNADGSDSWERYEDVSIHTAIFRDESPQDAESWLPMIQEAVKFTIEQETYYSREDYTFSLPVAWLPESLRENAEPEYLAWLQEQGREVGIAKEGRIVIDEAYPQNGQARSGTMELQ